MPTLFPRDRGFVTIATTLLLAIAFSFAVILVDTVLSGRFAGRASTESMSALQIAEAGMHHAVYCLNETVGTGCGGVFGISYAGQTDVTFSGGRFTVTVTGSGASKSVVSVGTGPTGRQATLAVDLTTIPPTDDIGFSYALQSGAGGARMENNSTISGTIYSNGDVECTSTNAIIAGDAYSAKVGGEIDSCRVNFHAYADKILNARVYGDAYYMNDPADISGTTVTGTKHSGSATPTSTILPAINLDFWRESSEAGGIISGNYSPADNSTLGPVKILGDLTMNNNVDVTVTGPIWVVGDILTGNNTSFTLSSAFGAMSTVILADDPSDMANNGRIDITNNTGIYGSGSSTSHILFATTNTSVSDTLPALSVANNASGAVFYAVNGTLRLQNNAGAKSLAGYRLFLDQNAEVTYAQSDFTGSFSNSPGGTWRILEGTWREIK